MWRETGGVKVWGAEMGVIKRETKGKLGIITLESLPLHYPARPILFIHGPGPHKQPPCQPGGSQHAGIATDLHVKLIFQMMPGMECFAKNIHAKRFVVGLV